MATHEEKLNEMQCALVRVETKLDTLLENEQRRAVARQDCENRMRRLECHDNQTVGGWKLAASVIAASSGIGGLCGWIFGKH